MRAYVFITMLRRAMFEFSIRASVERSDDLFERMDRAAGPAHDQ